MITLITGVPGSGKTAFAVDLLLREFGDRPIYVDGLNGLKLEHVPVDVLHWPEQVEDGGVVVVDEVQRKWRPRGPGAKVPDSVAALETHRHRGIDFVIITQNPRLVDSNVRNLVGRHVHVRDTGFMGRWLYEWPECSAEVAWRKCENKRRYRLPRRVFGLYKSASIHTKPVRRPPVLVYGVVVAAVAVAGFGWKIYQGFVERSAGVQASAVDKPKASSVLQSAGQVLAAPAGKAAPASSVQPVDERVDFVPRISGRPWTAPAYDGLRKIVAVPYIAGAMCIGADCRCYGADGGQLHDVGANDCRAWLDRREFNPYRVPVETASGGKPFSSSPAEPSENAGPRGEHPSSLAS